MKYSFLKTTLILLFLSICLSVSSCSKDDDSTENSNQNTIQDNTSSNVEKRILQLINDHRSTIDKQKLITNSLANALAKEHTLYMIGKNTISFDNLTQRAQRLFNEEDIVRSSESVAYKYNTPEEVTNELLKDDANKRNLEGDFTHIGISAIKNDTGVYYYTLIFLTK